MTLFVDGTTRLRRVAAVLLIALLFPMGFVGAAPEPPRDETIARLIVRLDKAKDERARRTLESEILAAARTRRPADGQAKPILEALPTVKNGRAKDSLFHVLGDLADPAALDTLSKAALDGDLAAVDALGKWPEIDPEETLRDLAGNGKNNEVKERALEGYIQVLRLPHERPAEKTVARLKEALDMATTLTQKRAALAGLSELPSAASLRIVEQYLDDTELGKEAAIAAERIRNAN